MPPAPPSGTRDFFAGEQRRRDAAVAVVRSVFERFGFEPLETPAFERIEVLTGKYGADEKLIFKIAKRGAKEASGEADLALRYDFTVPLARYVAGAGMREGDILRRYQIGPVWRADRPGRGRFREFFQCDVDVVGSTSPVADAEVISAGCEALDELGLGRFVVHLNSRKVLAELMTSYGVPAELHRDAFTAVDKLDKVGVDAVASEMGERAVPEAAIDAFRSDQSSPSPADAVLDRIAGGAAYLELREVQKLAAAAVGEERVTFDPFIARGLDYYTGPVYETFYEGDGDMPLSIASGGRYDDLIGTFTGRPMPATGISIGLERVLLLRARAEEEERPAARVLVCVWDESSRAESVRLAGELRRAGIASETYVGERGLKAQLRYASRREMLVAVIQGPDELASRSVAIKDLVGGDQRTVPGDELVPAVRRLLPEPSAVPGVLG